MPVPSHAQGVILKQDWEVIETIPDTPRLYILTDQQCAALLAITKFLHWQTRWINSPGRDILDAFASETEFNLMNPVTCAMLNECLADQFQAMSRNIIQSIERGFQSGLQPGEPLPDAEVNRDLADGTNPTCDTKILCGEIIETLNYLIQTVSDGLEVVALQTNELNLASVISEITGIDEVSIDALVDYGRLLRDGVALNFDAEITELYKDEVRCEIFCRCKHDCQLAVEDIYEVFRHRVNIYFETPGQTFATLQDILTYLVEQELDGNIVADALLFMCIGSAKLASTFLGDIGTTALEIVIRQAADVPQNDCDIDCEPCPAYTVPGTADPALDEYDTGLDVTSGTLYTLIADGTWNGGAGANVDADGQVDVFNEDAYAPTANLYSLIYRIGLAGTWTFAGVELLFTPGSSGRLYLALNDVPDAYGDNTGSLAVSVTA